jgi:hypothetical protein
MKHAVFIYECAIHPDFFVVIAKQEGCVKYFGLVDGEAEE